eukprot:scaffold146936_cov33-Prasinocladus_malaysianus.AAC.1
MYLRQSNNSAGLDLLRVVGSISLVAPVALSGAMLADLVPKMIKGTKRNERPDNDPNKIGQHIPT